MQLSSQSIRFLSTDSKIKLIDPFYEQFLQAGTYDFHLSGDLRIPLKTYRPFDLRHTPSPNMFHALTLSPGDPASIFILDVGQRALGRTIEYVRFPHFLQGNYEGKSSLGRAGLEVHKTAGVFDAGFEGFVVVELKNDGPDPWILYYGMPIGQMQFYQLDRITDKPYSKERNHYQEQKETVGNLSVDSPATNPFLTYKTE